MSDERILDKINTVAEKNNISKQYLQKLFFMEQFLLQVSRSTFHNNFILKGGFEIQSLFGLQNRMTEDIDTTLQGSQLNEENIRRIFKEIFSQSDSVVVFSIKSIKNEMADHKYPGMRVSLDVLMGKVKNTIKIDISTGDEIIPSFIKLNYKSILSEEENFQINAYPLEQIIADKLVTLIKFGGLNTRAKDFFDLYALRKMKLAEINQSKLLESFQKKAVRDQIALNYPYLVDSINQLRESEIMSKSWNRYQVNHNYATDISYNETLDAAVAFAQDIVAETERGSR